MRKDQLVESICGLVGADVAQLVDPRNGWPGLVRIRVDGAIMDVGLYVGSIGPMGRFPGQQGELRFQNPGQNRPMVAVGNEIPLLIGLGYRGNTSVLVGADAQRRMGDANRFSVRFPAWIVDEAAANGWADPYVSNTNERIYAFQPVLLPMYIQVRLGDLAIPTPLVITALEGTGLIQGRAESPEERVRRTASILVRDERFRVEVTQAYNGECSMCGLDSGLIVGAHILPASVPGSPDEAWNGLALCENHHRAFDNHMLWVDPESRQITISSPLLDAARQNRAARAFTDITFDRLAEPGEADKRPRANMFQQRYEYYESQYDWARL